MYLGHAKAIQYKDGVTTEIKENVVLEETVAIYYNGELITEQIASHDFLAELGVGFVVNEGISATVDEVDVEGDQIYVTGPKRKDTGTWVTGSSGGASSSMTPHVLHDIKNVTVSPASVEAIIAAIQSDEWLQTGGLHSSVLFRDDKLLIRCADVGRHNTVDKVVGWALLNNVDLRECVLGCTGRQPTGMVSKVANAQIPVIVSRAATSSRGIETAIETGITLIGFARPGRFTIYAHPERVIY
ncbi:MAG: formate dehydrogenase accessory sulfurtransferase FdhD [Euryarchaeota archaeon]|nr:formate dehydrogenase accessory sulfurtransferase FdhD [Euryarchaeota archaeon]